MADVVWPVRRTTDLSDLPLASETEMRSRPPRIPFQSFRARRTPLPRSHPRGRFVAHAEEACADGRRHPRLTLAARQRTLMAWHSTDASRTRLSGRMKRSPQLASCR